MPGIGLGLNSTVDVATASKFAQLAEERGFDSLWMHESAYAQGPRAFFGRDPILHLTSIAKATERMTLVPACINPNSRSPVLVALSMATLREISEGRTILSLGVGFHRWLDHQGIAREKPVAGLRESVEIIRRLWNGEEVTLRGKVKRVESASLMPGLAGHGMPIYLAVYQPQMLRLTGRIADGYVAKAGESAQSLAAIFKHIEAEAEGVGRSFSELGTAAYIMCSISSDSDEARNDARKDPFIIFMLSVATDQDYEVSGFDPSLRAEISESFFKGDLQEASERIPDDLLTAFTIAGDHSEAEDRVEEYLGTGLGTPIL
ncbi:MAG: LLM class flavin-dependent oxidoreductase, partial [Candidatus Geothermarchaeales archaeon]